MDAKSLGNEPAFPVIPPVGDSAGYPYPSSGITLRQHYAGLALQGLLACGDAHDEHTASVTANSAVALADALLAELSKDPAHEQA